MRIAKWMIILLMFAAWSVAAEVVFWSDEVKAIPGNEKEFQVLTDGKKVVSELIPVDPACNYLLAGQFRANGECSGFSFGLQMFDENRRPIHPHSVNAITGTETVLTQPAKKGDRFLLVRDASAWKLQQGKVVALGIQPKLADLPARTFSYYITAITPEDGQYRIILSKPLPVDLSAGTMIRQHGDARDFNAAWLEELDGNWEKYRHPIAAGEGYTAASERLWPGTRFVRVFLNAKPGTKIFFRDIELKKLTAAEWSGLRLGRRGEEVKPFGKFRRLAARTGTAAEVQPGSGFFTAGLQWSAAGTRQIEMQLKSDTPGMFELIWAGRDENDKWFSVRKSHTVIPDRQFHWLRFPVSWPEGRAGTITNLQMNWRSEVPARLTVAGLTARQQVNLIPGATELQPRETVMLHYLRPRLQYRLRWVEGVNPGMSLSWLDRNDRVIGEFRLPIGTTQGEVVMPPLAVRAGLTVEKSASGYPELSEIKTTAAAEPRWRGEWIWCRKGSGPEWTNVWFEREFELPESPVESAALAIAADDHPWVYLNGKLVGSGGSFVAANCFDVTGFLKPGKNLLTIRVLNGIQEGGLLCNLYVRSGGREHYVVTGPDWRYQIGTAEKPAAIQTPAVVLGNPATTEPWAGRLDYRYAGPRGKLKVLSTASGSFTAEIQSPLPQLPQFLRAKAVTASGKERVVMLKATLKKDGNRLTVSFPPPYSTAEEPQMLYLDEERLETVSHASIGTIPGRKQTTGLAEARYVAVGGRTRLVIDGESVNPFFWALPASFANNSSSNLYLASEAREAGYRNFALLTDFPEIWKGPGQFDFTALDARVAQLLDVCPDAIFLLQVGCYMPEWWLNANPDDVTAHANGSPRATHRESQALASKKWLKDAEIPLNALVQHIRNRSWGKRVWGASVSENRNWEWFWTITDKDNKPAVSGYSKSDYAAFRDFLRRKYRTDEELAKQWKQSGVTLANARMPSPEIHTRGRVGALLDPQLDRQLMDWFEFRNLVLAEAVISLGKTIKEATDGKWLTGAYYGYFIEMCVNIGRAAHDHGHNGFWETAKSPYVDFVRAPTRYLLRKIGWSDGIMQPQDTYTLHGKVVYIECDLRTAYRPVERPVENYVAHPTTGFDTVSGMNRTFGMMLASGTSYYWYDITSGAFREPVLVALLKEQSDVYHQLPPVRNLTPREMAIVGDRDSVYYTKRNSADGILPVVIGELIRNVNDLAAPHRVMTVGDLLDGSAAPHKFYLMTNALMLSRDQREALMRRFEREKATVLWFYAPGAFYPDQGPAAEYCGDFLGLKMEMINRKQQPKLRLAPGWGVTECVNANTASPWFYPVGGFEDVVGRDEQNRPALVKFQRNGATHYFSTLLNLPVPVLRTMAEKAGVRFYSPGMTDSMWIGNDVVFLHARSGGEKRIDLPPGTRLRGIIGPLQGKLLKSGQPWQAEAAQTYGFLVEPEK